MDEFDLDAASQKVVQAAYGRICEDVRRRAKANAIYASIVSRAYERLVESMEPEEAMRGAIERAEEVVRVWEKVVSQ